MTRLRKYIFVILGSAVLLFSCDKPSCKNENTVFNQFTPGSSEYKNELIKQLALQKEGDLSYWFDSYQAKDNKEYILVDIHGKDLCAKGLFLVEQWTDNMQGLKQARGQGYHVAELTNLKMDVKRDDALVELVVVSIDRIID